MKTTFPRAVFALLAIPLAVSAAGEGGRNGYYVWQRHWTPAVEATLSNVLSNSQRQLYVLGGELAVEATGQLAWASAVPPEDLVANGRVTVVFRLPVAALDCLEKTAEAVADRASRAGATRLQLDVDVPESRLPDYARLLAAVRHRLQMRSPPLVLGATFLPCHLEHETALRQLLRYLDEPVLQLHGIDPPQRLEDGWALMRRDVVFPAIERAQALDSRFRFALPTYAYVLEFAPDGSFSRLHAESFPGVEAFPPDRILQLAAPDPALLVEACEKCGPGHVVWFRLPMPGLDRLALDTQTLADIEGGLVPAKRLRLESVRPSPNGPLEIWARHEGYIPLAGRTVPLTWQETPPATGEFWPLGGCKLPEPTVAGGPLPTALRIAPHACGERFLAARVLTQAEFCDLQLEDQNDEEKP